MKKIVKWLHTQRILVFAVLVTALLGIGGTMALFTDTENAKGSFEVGNNTITVEEEVENLTKKNIGITNTGTVPVYVRMQVNVPNGVKYLAVENGKQVEKTLKAVCTPENPTGWESAEDGFWYYEKPLQPGNEKEGIPAETAILFTSISFVNEEEGNPAEIPVDQMEAIKELLDITVYGESVQSEGLPDDVTGCKAAFEYIASLGEQNQE